MKNKKLLIFIIIAIIILFSVVIYNVFNYTDNVDLEENNNLYPFDTNNIINSDIVGTLENGDKINKSDKIKQEQDLGNITIKNLTITSSKENYNVAKIKFDILNNSSDILENINLEFSFLDKENKQKNVILFIVPTIKSNETLTIQENTLYRVIDSYNFKVEQVVLKGKA